MTPVYGIKIPSPKIYPHTLNIVDGLVPNNWIEPALSVSSFEDAVHLLQATDDDYNQVNSDLCADVCDVESGVFAFSEQSWDLLPRLENSGCRIAHNVKMVAGKKRFKLVYVEPVLDIQDIENSQVSWNDHVPSWVTNEHFYEVHGTVPLMFQVRYHNRNQMPFNGVTSRRSGKAYVSLCLKQMADQLALTGLDFYEIPRTKRL